MNWIKMIEQFVFAALVLFGLEAQGQNPKVWIYTDMTDNTLLGNNHMGTINDPDDISAMAGYLLMANMFDTKGIVVASTHRREHKTTPHQGEWANRFWGEAYHKDLKNLNKIIGGYPEQVDFVQSCIKESAERYNPDYEYTSLNNYTTVKSLFDLANNEDGIINVLCWGSLTEPAILVNHCISAGRMDLLDKLRFIAHWTNSPWHQGSSEHPEDVANCREDAEACAYLKLVALNGYIKYYECGAIGQHGIVSGSPKGEEYYKQFAGSALGEKFIQGKFVQNAVDHSDAATYWVLLENWGVRLADVKNNGANPPEVEKANEEKFKQWSERIHNELLRRALVAAGK